MEKMSKNNEKKLLRALDKAANLSRSGLEPDHVLTKVAGEFQLTPQEICRVVETYNKAKSVAFLKNASSDFRANDFPLADSKKVISNIYSKEEKEATEKDIPLKDYAAMCSYTQQEKVAAEAAPHKRDRSCDRDKASIWKEALAFEDLQNGVQKDLETTYAETRKKLENSMQKVSKHCEFAKEKELKKVARLIINAHGKQGEMFIDDINKRMMKPTLPILEKTAHAAMFPIGEPYIAIAEAFTQGEKLAKVAKDMEFFQKQADAGLEAAIGASSALKNVMKSPAKAKPEFIDSRTGLSPEWDNYLKALQAKKMLYTLYRFDPLIKSYPLEDVTEVYNEMAELTPSLANNKAWMRATMRRMLTQGKVSDPFELKDMMTGESQHTQALQSHVNTLTSMYGDAERGVDQPPPENKTVENIINQSTNIKQ